MSGKLADTVIAARSLVLRQFSQSFQKDGYVERLIAGCVGALGQRLLDQLLHGAALPCDQHRSRVRIRLLHQAEHVGAAALRELHVDQYNMVCALR